MLMFSRAIVLLILVGIGCPVSARENGLQEAGAKTRPPKQATIDKNNDKNNEKAPERDAADTPVLDLTVVQREMQSLAEQIQLLTSEVKRLRRATETNSNTSELLLLEERLMRVEDKIDVQQDKKAALDIRELESQARLRNIQQELLFRGGLRRDETEAAIRADVQRSLQDIQNQRNVVQQRITELQNEAARLRFRIDELQKKMEKTEKPEEKSR